MGRRDSGKVFQKKENPDQVVELPIASERVKIVVGEAKPAEAVGGEARIEGKAKLEDDEDVVIVAGVSVDNRNFVMMNLGGKEVKTLADPGATLSMVGPDVAERFRERLKPINMRVRTATGKISKVWKYFELL